MDFLQLQYFQFTKTSFSPFRCPDEAYSRFINTFTELYDTAFPIYKIKVKTKSLLSPWITKGILKSSKRKHKLYDKFLKRKTYTNETNYKNYKNLFETIKFKAKKLYYSNLIIKYQNNIKKTWQVIKEVIGKTQILSNNLLRRLIIGNEEIHNKKLIAENFNDFFATVGPKLAESIPKTTKGFDEYVKKVSNTMPKYELTNEEFRNAFFSLKSNKSPGYDGISSNIVKNCFHSISSPLKHIFNLSICRSYQIL